MKDREIKKPKQWLNEKIAEEYQDKYKKLVGPTEEITKEVRELMLELKKECNVTELEAVCIFRNTNVENIVLRHYRDKVAFEKQVEALKLQRGDKNAK